MKNKLTAILLSICLFTGTGGTMSGCGTADTISDTASVSEEDVAEADASGKDTAEADASGKDAAEDDAPQKDTANAGVDQNKEADGNAEVYSDSLPAYQRPDGEAFSETCEKLKTAAEEGDSDAVISLYDALYADYGEAADMYNIAMVRYWQDVTSDYWEEEQEASYEIVTDIGDEILNALSEAAKGSCGEALEDHLGQEIYESLLLYEPLTDEERELLRKEQELEAEYMEKSTTSISEVSYTYKGTSYTYESFSDVYLEMAEKDYDGYLEVRQGILKGMNDLLGPIFLDLLQVRVQIAECCGYDNYADYAYENLYGRDYTCEDAETYCDIIRENAALLYSV